MYAVIHNELPLSSLYTALAAFIGTYVDISVKIIQVRGWVTARETKAGSFLASYATLLQTTESRWVVFLIKMPWCSSVELSFVMFNTFIGRLLAEIRRVSSLSDVDRYDNGSPFRSLGQPTNGKIDLDGWSMMPGEVRHHISYFYWVIMVLLRIVNSKIGFCCYIDWLLSSGKFSSPERFSISCSSSSGMGWDARAPSSTHCQKNY